MRPANSPLLALESALAQPPSLILLDVKMPEMDVFEVCRRLKQEERTRDIPVIFVSALKDVQDRVLGFEAGGVDFISKPFQEPEVLARVRTHLALRNMQLHLADLVAKRNGLKHLSKAKRSTAAWLIRPWSASSIPGSMVNSFLSTKPWPGCSISTTRNRWWPRGPLNAGMNHDREIIDHTAETGLCK